MKSMAINFEAIMDEFLHLPLYVQHSQMGMEFESGVHHVAMMFVYMVADDDGGRVTKTVREMIREMELELNQLEKEYGVKKS